MPLSWLGRGLLLLAGLVFVTACAGGGGGGGGGGGPAPAVRGLFSHAAYDFILANTTRLNAASASRVLGVVYLEEAEVQAQIGPESEITGVAYTLTGLEQSFFSITPRQAVDVSGGVRVLFGSPNFPNTPLTLDYVVNTLGVDRMTVTATITYVDAQGSEQELTVSVPVSVRAVREVPSVNAFLVFEGVRRAQRVVNTTAGGQTSIVQQQLRFTADGALAEDAGARAGVDGLSAALTRLNIRLSRPAGFTRLPTVYFRLANASGAADCGRVFYLDNRERNIRTRAGEQLNYEAQAAYGCKLEASLRGLNYTEVVARPSGAALDGIDNVSGTVASGSGNMTACAAGALAVVRAGGCAYRAEFAIAVRDVNEPVHLNVTLGNRSVYEGDVGGLTDAPAVGAVPQRDVLLARVRYHEQDHDEANERLRVAAPVLAAMTPQAAPDLFIVRPHGSDEVGLYLNASAVSGLDYETLAVNATGQKSYRLLLRATDNSTEALVTDAAVHVAVQDVVYAPTNFTYRNASDVAVTEQLLLPGLAQFVAHGGPVLGTLRALDPETRQMSVVDYAYVGVSGLVPADPRRHAAINGSFALTAARVDGVAEQLSLVGLGLRAGDRFTLNLTAVHGAAVHPLPAMAYARLGVAIRVAYQPDVDGYGARPPVRFTAGVLNGTVPEGVAGASVFLESDDLRAHVDAQSAAGTRSFDLLDAQEINALLTAAPGLDSGLRSAIDRALQGLDRADATAFELDMTTGALRLKAEQVAHFTTKPFYTLLVRVSNTTAVDYARSDYALITVAVEDTNLAPRLVALRATDARLAQADQTAGLTLELPEDTKAGTEMARLEVMDDNPLHGLTWDIDPASPAASMFAVTPMEVASRRDPRTGNYTGIYVLQTTTALNYEALPQGRLALTLFLTDGGQYGLDPQRRVYALGDGHHNVTVAVGGNVTDVNEPLALRVASTAAVAEDAAVGTRIVAVAVVDPDGDVGTARKLITQLRSEPASLAPALALVNFSVVSANRSRWDLVVANASLLENAGDGRTFDVMIMVTENRSDAPTRATARLALTVTDVVHDFVVPDLTNLALNISEQQALDASSGLVLREDLFSFSADVQADYDEFWFGGFRAVDMQARAGEMRYAAAIETALALQREETFNLLNLRTRGDTVDLLLGETRLIEDKLIGARIELMVELVDPSGAVASATLPVPVTIVASEASDDRVRFADADAGFGVEVPSAYAFRYAQSDYTPALSASACRAEDPAMNITLDERCYATVRLEDGRDYVQRDRRKQRYFRAEDATALRNGTGAEIGLVFTDADVNVSSLGVYALNAEGNLRAADTEFERYFELAVDQRYPYAAAPRPALVVRPRVLAVLNRTTGQPLANQSYLALDTFPLSNADPRRSLQFFVLALEDGGEANNATQRALAQLNFEVAAANLNTPVAAELVLGRHRLAADAPLMLVANGVDRDLEAAVNTPMPILNFSIHNPDGFARNQSVTAVVDVVATQAGDLGNGSFDLEQGTADGRDLVRLGAAADARHRLNITLGSNQTVRTVLPFQLARNTRGSALVRLHLVERDAEGFEVANRVVYYELRVRAGEVPRPVLAPLTINDVSGPIGENVLDALTAQGTGLHLNITLTVPQAEAPHNLMIHQVNVTGQSAVLRVAPQGIQRPDPAMTVFRQALVHTRHQYGPTRFAITTQVREPRGFGDQLSAPYFLPTVGREIAVNQENDPLTVVCDADGVNCGYRPARYLLSALNPARVGSALVPSGTEVVRVLFADDDLLAGRMPPATVTNFVDADPADALSLDGNNFAVNAPDIAIQHAGATNRFNVTFPVRLRLTQGQFDTLNASGVAETLAFRFTLADPGSSGTVDADGSIELLPDRDGDGIADADDSCPLIANADRQGDDMDTDDIGDLCEARSVTDLRAVADDLDTVNLTWTNPAESVLRAMNISYHPTNAPNSRTTIDITADVSRAAGAAVRYQVIGLATNTAYTFVVGGIDFRHGLRNQTLPPASINATTLPDTDSDGITDGADNCPAVANAGGQEEDDDGDGIGDACEAVGVSGLTVTALASTTISLSWTNPSGSDLQELSINYGLVRNATRTVRVLPSTVSLTAGASVTYDLTGLSASVNHITIGGIDFRHGLRNQTLPPRSVMTNDTDRDGILDGLDNCMFTPNANQADTNSDSYGDVCSPDDNNDGIREIQTVAQLSAVRSSLGARYELVTDIDLNSTNWTPIGERFSGVFDGNGYTIYNLSIQENSSPNHGSYGLFKHLAGSATVRNFTLTVNSIVVTGPNSSPGHTDAGGLVGREAGIIHDIAVIVKGPIRVTSRNPSVGGIIGEGEYRGSISNSYVIVMTGGDIQSYRALSTQGAQLAGGIMGFKGASSGETQVRNSYVLVLGGGKIRSDGPNAQTGGLVGRYRRGHGVVNSYVAVINGAITSSRFLGGLIGTGTTSGTGVTHSYYVPATLGGGGTGRTLPQLTCPTNANRNCTGATTYTGWDNATIWDFGDDGTLPDLRSNRRPAYINELLP